MTQPQESLRIEDLLAQSDWVRRLVLGLVRDADVADDIVQETWARALENAPRAEHGTSSLRLWLATVARRLALRRVRSEQSRKQREEAIPSRGPVDPAELFERVALQRDVATQVLELDEPHRTAVVMRFQDGCSVAEIAERLGISQEAARQRISRGLARLRARLEGRYGVGPGGWIAAVAPLLRMPAKVAPAAASLFTAVGLWGAVLTAVATIVTGVWLWPSPEPMDPQAVPVVEQGDSKPKPDPVAPPAARELAAASAEIAHEPGGLDHAVIDEATAGESGDALATIDLSSIDRGMDLHGHVLDADGAPLPAAQVLATAVADNVYELSAAAAGTELARTRSDANGAFVLRLPFGANVDLRVSAHAFGTQVLPDRRAGELVDVRLQPAAAFTCRLVAAGSGEPLVDVPVRLLRLWTVDGVVRELARATSDGAGLVRMPALPAGRMILEVAAPGSLTRPLVFRLQPGEQKQQRIEVAAGREVTVEVVAAESGDAVAMAELVASHAVAARPQRSARRPSAVAAGLPWAKPSVVVTDASGRATVTVPADFAFVQVAVRAPGFAPAVIAMPAGPHARVELHRGMSLQGRVTGPDGVALAGAQVITVATGVGHGVEQADWQSTSCGAAGEFAFSHLRADLSLRLEVRHPKFAPLSVTPTPGVQDLGVLAMSVGRRLLGKVEQRDAQPATGVYVRAFSLTGEQLACVRSDDLGRFAMPLLPTGPMSLWAGDVRIDYVLRENQLQEHTEVVRMVLQGDAVFGVVTDPNGEPIAQAMVVLVAEDPAFMKRTQVTESDGRFAFPNIGSGNYAIAVAPNSVHLAGGDRMVHAMNIGEVLPGPGELSIVLPWAAVTRGVVVDEGGQPQPHQIVFARDRDGQLITYEFTSPDGTFVLRLPPGSKVDLAVGKQQPRRIVLRDVVAGIRNVRVVAPK